MRLEDLQGWITQWATPEMYAGIPGMGATDAWYDALVFIEEAKIEEEELCGGVADIMKFFDQIVRGVVYHLAEAAGMPMGILQAYTAFAENLNLYNCLAGGVGTPFRRKCGIMQGCPLSMTYVALLMRPWIIIMRGIKGVKCYILADDLLIIAKGATMIGAA